VAEAVLLSSLVGRQRQLDSFRGWVDAVAAGRGRVVLVEGEPGIGKSSLVRVAAAHAEAVGCHVLWGAGDELSQAFPLLPLLDAVNAGIPDAGARHAAIMQMLRGDGALGNRVDHVAAAAEQVLALVDEVCAAAPVMLVVDDLQWADPATVMTWRQLARSVHQLPLLLVGVSRPVPRRTDLVTLRRAVEPAGVLRLTALSESDTIQLVTRAVGSAPGARLLRLARGAGGNPLYLTELLDALTRAGTIAVEDGQAEVTAARPPGSLAAAIADRLAFLSGPVRDLLRAAALLGAEFPVSDLVAVSGQRVNDLLPLLDEAIVAGVLRDGGSGLAFRHPMIRAALYQELPASVRAAWHRDAGRALALAGAPAERVARQLLPVFDGGEAGAEAAGPGLVDGWILDWLVDAAHQLVGQAPRAAIPLLRAAVAAAPPGAAPHDLLACRLADALYRAGDATAAAQVASATLEHVTRPDLLVDLHWTLTQCRAMEGRSEESLVALDRALGTPGIQPRQRARLLVLTARTHRSRGRVDTARRVAASALDEATAAGDRWATGWALGVLTIAHAMLGELDEALPLFERALAVTEGDPALADLRLMVQINYAVALGDLDRYDAAIQAAQEVGQRAEQAGNVLRIAQARSVLGELLFDVGRWDDALAEVELADPLAGPCKDPVVECSDRGIAATIRLHRGDAGARRVLSGAGPYAARIGSRLIGSLALARSLDLEQAGAPAAAVAALTEGLSETAEELEEVGDLLADGVRLAVTVHDRAAAVALTARADALARDSTVPHRAATALHCHGLLDADPITLIEAGARYAAASRVLPRAQALEAAAIILAEGGDAAGARAQFTEAFERYTALGAGWDLARVQARFRTFGIRRGPHVRHRRATHGWESLTPTEVKIAGLVARGLSNPQIATQLFLSRRTVQSHVSHILSKLDLHSRTDIAREVGRRESA